MDFSTFVLTYYKYIISAFVSAVFLVVNIIQFIRSKDKKKLKDALCRLPEFIRFAEELADYLKWSPTTATTKAAYKKSTVESMLSNEFGDKFVKKYIRVFDDAIEDILNTPAKKGGTYVSKENDKEER